MVKRRGRAKTISSTFGGGRAKRRKLSTDPFISFLADPRVDNHSRASLLKITPERSINSLANAAYNFKFNKRLRLTPKRAKQFKAHEDIFRILTNPKTNFRTKRKKLQTGGVLPFLPVLLGAALGTITAGLFK